jgi:hypothetical protein
MITKVCSRCKKEKNENEFSLSEWKRNSGWCRECKQEYDNNRLACPRSIEQQKCEKCGQTKESSEFYINKKRKKGLRSSCKECTTKHGKQYYQYNKEKDSERKKKYNQTLEGRFTSFKSRSKQKNRIQELTFEQFTDITKQTCHYCGQFLEGKNYCGIDRTNSSIGYILNNCVPCCQACNEGKMSRTKEQFLEHCRKIVDFNK